MATPATLSILVVAVRANGRARFSPAASREKTWPVEGRRSPPHPSSPIAGARPNSAPPPDAGEMGTVDKIREWAVAASAAVGRIRRALRSGSSFACAAVGACRSPAPLVPPLVTLRQFSIWSGSRGQNGAVSPPLQSGRADSRQVKVRKRERRRRAEKGGKQMEGRRDPPPLAAPAWRKCGAATLDDQVEVRCGLGP